MVQLSCKESLARLATTRLQETAFRSPIFRQYANQAQGGALFVPEEEIRERTFAEARHYGLLAGVRYGEPFVQKEVGLVDDLTLVPVQSL